MYCNLEQNHGKQVSAQKSAISNTSGQSLNRTNPPSLNNMLGNVLVDFTPKKFHVFFLPVPYQHNGIRAQKKDTFFHKGILFPYRNIFLKVLHNKVFLWIKNLPDGSILYYLLIQYLYRIVI